jgi:hypothetical protein
VVCILSTLGDLAVNEDIRKMEKEWIYLEAPLTYQKADL